jgi:CBS domain containing-hemolysin-like protein
LIEPDSTTLIFLLIVLLTTHALFAAVKEAVANVRKLRRLQWIEEKVPAAKAIERLAENPTLLLSAEQVVLKIFGAFFVVSALVAFTEGLAALLAINYLAAALWVTLGAALLLLIFGELVPREIGRRHAETIASSFIAPLYAASYLAKPLAEVVTRIGRILAGGRWEELDEAAAATITEEDLLSYVDAGEEEGVLEEDEQEMIYSIFGLADTTAREVMVPRIDIVAVEAGSSIDEAMDTIIKAGHSRVPVYEDTIDNIIGILYVKDLLIHWLKDSKPESIRGLERSVYYVPETKAVSDLLRELQTKKVHIAVVVDEYGGTSGLVTIEDILEEIVGEIQDEHDSEEALMQYISENEYIFNARMDLDDINDILSIHLPTDESDTLGGLIYDVLGRIPEAGEVLDGASFNVPNVEVKVLDVEGRRIKRARVKLVSEAKSNPLDNSEPGRKQQGSSALISKTQNSLS